MNEASAIKFTDCEELPTEEQITSFEHELSLQFPRGLREHYLRANGGSPDPYMYEDDNVDTVVSQCFPLRRGKGSAISYYEILVLKKALVPKTFFPLAVDGSGDIFFVDCSSDKGLMYLWHHEIGESLVALNVSIDEFWTRLKPDPYLKPKS
jgi:cell wall assembly regulator SMI1